MNLFILNFKTLKAFILSVLIFLSLIIFSELILQNTSVWRWIDYFSVPISDDAIRFEYELKKSSWEESNNKIFLMGSSQTREGVDFDYLKTVLKYQNTAVYNLGASGVEAIDIFMSKNKIIDQKPNTIILLTYVGTFYRNYNYRKMKYYFHPKIIYYMWQDLGPRIFIDNINYFIDSMISQTSLLYRHKESFGRIIKKAFNNFTYLKPLSRPIRYAYSGNVPRDFIRKGIDNKDCQRYHLNNYSRLNKKLFQQFIQSTVDHNIKPIIINMPSHPWLKECYGEAIENDYQRFLEQEANSKGLTYLNQPKLPQFTDADFHDLTHLNSQGREKFTKFLADYIKNINDDVIY